MASVLPEAIASLSPPLCPNSAAWCTIFTKIDANMTNGSITRHSERSEPPCGGWRANGERRCARMAGWRQGSRLAPRPQGAATVRGM